MPPYDIKRTLWKAAKVAAVAGATVLVVDPNLTPAILAAIPAEYRVLGAVLVPALITAVRNWLKNANIGF